MNSTKRSDWSKIGRRVGYSVSFVLVAGVAAYVSYGHIYEVALLAHQPRHLAYVLPLSVDGLMLIATLAMAEDKAANRKSRGWARVALWTGAAVSVAANIGSTLFHYGWEAFPLFVAGWAPVALFIAIEVVSRPGKPKPAPAISEESKAPETIAEIESGTLPEAPVSPAIPRTAKAPAEAKGRRKPYGPTKGEEYSERHDRRLRNGK